MAFLAYMTVSGKKQGQFKGETTAAQHKDTMPVLAFEMDLTAPRDLATGQASGKRQYQPVTIVKQWGAASPQGLTACATNEVLPTVKIEFFTASPDGKESAFQTVMLTNATISAVRRFTGDAAAVQGLTGTSKDAAELERWSFVFQKIEVDDVPGKTTFVDDWQAIG